MSITLNVYDYSNNVSKTVTVDIMGDILAANDSTPTPGTASTYTYFLKFTTSGRQNNGSQAGGAYAAKIARDLSEFPLNKLKRSKLNSDTAYTDLSDLIEDYVYDYINGHTAEQWDSGCELQYPMKFS